MITARKQKMIEIFEDTQNYINTHSKLNSSTKKSKKNTHVYAEWDLIDKTKCKRDKTLQVSVVQGKTFETAMKIAKDNINKKILVHNFASATNPGGGVVKGCTAQEECLCRCSNLYNTLSTDELFVKYYKYHRDKHDTKYTERCIYSPNITIFKTDTDEPQLLPEEEWCNVDVITCAAPNLINITISDKELLELHKKRAMRMLDIAESQNVDIVILGAFGCGAFRNKPEVVARAYKDILNLYKNSFEQIIFAIYYNKNDMINYTTFNRILGNYKI